MILTKKSTNITGSYREREGRMVREKRRMSQLKATHVSACECLHAIMCGCACALSSIGSAF